MTSLRQEPQSYKLIRRKPKEQKEPEIVLTDVGEKAKSLVRELAIIDKEYKSGSPEREQKLDEVYTKLYSIAKNIEDERKKGNTTNDTEELYFLITSLPMNNTTPTNQINQYGDTFELFMNDKPTIRTAMFLKQMAYQLNNMSAPHDMLMKNHGVKKIIYDSMHNCQRKEWLEHASKHTCEQCWNEVMYILFIMAAKTFTVELKTQANKIESLYKGNLITMEDSQELGEIMTKTIVSFEKLLDKVVKKPKRSKDDWIVFLETLFALVINLMNEIMMKYVNSMKATKELSELNTSDLL